jgi:DNA polymerase-3 subunit beta
MKAIVNQGDLKRGLEIVRRATSPHGALPITANVLIRADGDHLALTGNKLEFAITHRIPAQVEDEGAITVPAAQLAKMVALLPNAPLTLEQGSLRVTAGGVTVRFVGQSAPGALRPVGGGNYVNVIMPMFVQWEG